MLTVGSTFTGVGGADIGLEQAGYQIKWQCELDAWKRSVLAAHWPNVPIYDDIMTLVDPEPVDVMIGGFPCQDLSVAGKRKGFNGSRSVLAFEFLRVAESLRPRWLVLENVPGLLSSNKGLDFQRLLNEVVACGYGVGWRCLDARYFGVPQRRRRIFLVARRAEVGINTRAASELALHALCESGSGDSTPGWPPRQILAAGAGRSVADGRSIGVGGDVSHTLTSEGHDASEDGTGRGTPIVAGSLTKRYGKGVNTTCDDGAMVVAFGHTQGIDPQASETATPTLRKNGGGAGIAYRKSARVSGPDTPETWVADGPANTLNGLDVGDVRTTHAVVETASTLQASGKTGGHRIDAEGAAGGQREEIRDLGNRSGALTGQGTHQQTYLAVRRLTPVECERLMGWPDNWTAPEAVKAPDSKRYAACGDGIVASVAYWIGQRINMIEGIRHD